MRFAMWGKTEQVRTSGKNLFNIKGETTFSKGTFDIKDNLIDCTLEDTWGGSYVCGRASGSVSAAVWLC